MQKIPRRNTLYYGDNLAILREHVEDESVDLVYLDPPFNSNASYNVLFRAPEGHQSQAQIEAFDDTWHWNEPAERAFDEVLQSGNSDAAEMLRAMRSFLKENDMMAYLTMMAVRLLELHRVLKPTGSLYLHCDPTASHYLKILLDSVFDPRNFRSEIIWRRSAAHNKLSRQFGPIHDTILFYAKSNSAYFKPATTPYTRQYIKKMFRYSDEGGSYRLNELTGAGIRAGDSGKAWRLYDPTAKGRHWAIPASLRNYLPNNGEGMTSQKMLDVLAETGNIVTSPAGRPTYKQRAAKGIPYQDIWAYQGGTAGSLEGTEDEIDADVKWLDSEEEKLPYPTQKPVGLIERIIESSSKKGELVLDPFCGCGTTVHAAQKLNRLWIGIDITHLAIHLIKRRLNEAFPDTRFDILGVPKDLDGARVLALQDKYEFQKWALAMIDAQPFKGGKKGGDRGVDGFLYIKPDGKKTEKVIVSVKGGQSLNPAMVKDLIVTVDQEGAKMGVFLTLEPPTKGMVTQAAAAGFYKTEYGQFPKIQIVTVEQLFGPSNPLHLPWQDTSVFKKAKREKTEKQSELDL
jgi:DNA modification methylase